MDRKGIEISNTSLKNSVHNNKGNSNNTFLLSITGRIESALIFGVDEIYCKYNIVYGGDWKVTSGIEEGISQITGKNSEGEFIWNFPIEVTFKSSNPHGWPTVIVSIYGSDFFGNHIIKGYGSIRIPVCCGSYTKNIALFVPESSTFLQKLSSLIVGRQPEFVDPKILAHSDGRQVIRVHSNGNLCLKLEVLMKDFEKLGYISTGSTANNSSTTL